MLRAGSEALNPAAFDVRFPAPVPATSQTESASPERVAASSPAWPAIFVITFGALAVRLVAVHFLYRAIWNDFSNHLLFGFEIGRIARSIAEGHGFGNPLYIETGPTAWVTPVYPVLLAVIFKLFGVYSRVSALVILTLNSLFSALVCIPIYLISVRTFGRRTALLASCFWAVYPAAISNSVFVWETSLTALLLTTLFLWTLRLRQNPSAGWNWLVFGLAWGVATLTNASILSLFPFLVAWALSPILHKRRSWISCSILAVLGLAVVLLPWQVRNYRAFHQFVPLRSTFWLEMWVGNDGYTQTMADVTAHPSINAAQRDAYAHLGEMAYMQVKRDQVLDVVSSHPRWFVWRCWRRFVYIWTGYWNRDPINWEKPWQIWLASLTTVLMLLGLRQALRRTPQVALAFCLVLAVYPLVFYVTHPAARYRLVIDPEILILAALGVVFLASRIRSALIPAYRQIRPQPPAHADQRRYS